MAIRYEYWRHVLTGDIYAVKLDDARVIGACLMDRHEAHEELLPLLLYLDKHVADVERDRRYFSRYERVKRYSGRSSFSTSPAFAWTAARRRILSSTVRLATTRLPDVAQRRSPCQMKEDVLRQIARKVVQDGKLPSRRPDRTWGGPGVGAPCEVCGVPVGRNEMEFEIQFARDGDNPGLDKFHVHIRCCAAWEFERESRDQR